MLGVRLGRASTEPLRVLLLGAHADDIEIGCGGTVLDLAQRYPRLAVHWVVLSAGPERKREAETGAARFLVRVAEREVIIEDFRDGYFPYEGGRVKDAFEALKARVAPDLVLTHYRDDAHQDHRLVAELTWNTFRDHLVLEYEVPKFDPEIGAPNVFVPLPDALADAKVQHILDAYPSQQTRPWFTADTFRAVMRLRGVQARAPRYAEAFYCRKAVLAGP